MPIIIDYKKCCWKDGKCTTSCCGEGEECSGCVEICPVEALERKNKLELDAEKCIDCGACISVCPKDALSLDE